MLDTIKCFIEDYGILSTAIVSAALLFKQLRNTHRWNQVQFTFSLINTPEIINLEEKISEQYFEAFSENIYSIAELTSTELEKINAKENGALRNLLTDYLNRLEGICCAVEHNLVEETIAIEMLSEKIVRTYKRYKVFIDWHREEGDDLYTGLEKLSEEWAIHVDTGRPIPSKLRREIIKLSENGFSNYFKDKKG